MVKLSRDVKLAKLKAFPPIASANARVLILGSMPSVASIAEYQYYAHPRNHFWIIMDALFSAGPRLSYKNRCRRLSQSHVALWDVIAGCMRQGSLDSHIVEKSICVNEFNLFFKQHDAIHSVFFNGGKAEQVYRKYVLHTLSADAALSYFRLPSTSPANATWNLSMKLKAWEIVKLKADIIS